MSKNMNYVDQQKNVKPKPKHKMKIVIVLTAIIVALIIILMPKKIENHSVESSNSPKFKKQGELTLSDIKGKSIITIDIEIADNDTKREIGMMGRTSMEERQGMLFIFDEEYPASFWMRNTILPLDMIFVNKQKKIITIHENTTPFSDDNYSATGLTLYVLEVNAGFCEKYGIKEGDIISWKRN